MSKQKVQNTERLHLNRTFGWLNKIKWINLPLISNAATKIKFKLIIQGA